MAVKKGYKQTEVGVIPEDWGVRPIREISNPVRGGSPRPAGDPRFFDGNFIPWLTVAALTNIPSSQLKVSHTDSSLTEEGSLRSRILYPGTLILANSGATLGVAKILGIKCCANDGIAALLNFNATVSTTYLVHYINTRTQYLRDVVATGNGQPNLNTDLIGNFKVPLPPTLTEQEAIAGALSDADAWIESLEQLIAKKRQIKQGAMQELLTGKRRLSGFSGEWEKCSVGDVIEKAFCGPSPTCEERNIHGEEWGVLKTTAMTWEHGWDWTKHKRLPEHYWNQPEIEVHTGDVVVTKAGPRHRVGVAAFVNYVPDRILVSGKMIGLRPNAKRALGFMLAAAISAPSSQKFLDQRTTGMAESQVNFENGVLIGTPICLPSISEQHAIGSTLSDMDAEIDSLESKLAKAREIKQGMMQELLTGRIRLIEN